MSSVEQQARDLLDRVRQVLGAIPPTEEWVQVGLGNIHANPVGSQPPRAKTWSNRIGDLVAEAPTLIRDLAASVEQLLKITDIINPESVHREQRDAALAEVSRLRAQETRIRALCEEARGWKPYDTRDIGEAILADSVTDLLNDILAALDTEGER